jgi:excisionase family DNA binding protein
MHAGKPAWGIAMTVYDKKSAASFLGVSAVTIDRLKRSGRLPYHKLGDRVIFTQADIDRLLEATAVPAPAAGGQI